MNTEKRHHTGLQKGNLTKEQKINELVDNIKTGLSFCIKYNCVDDINKNERTNLKSEILLLFKFCDVKLTDYHKEIFNIWHDISFNNLIEQTDDMVTNAIDDLEYYERDFETLNPYEEEDK